MKNTEQEAQLNTFNVAKSSLFTGRLMDIALGTLCVFPPLERTVVGAVLDIHTVWHQTSVLAHTFIHGPVPLGESPFARNMDL